MSASGSSGPDDEIYGKRAIDALRLEGREA
jgi:hypothetical protein